MLLATEHGANCPVLQNPIGTTLGGDRGLAPPRGSEDTPEGSPVVTSTGRRYPRRGADARARSLLLARWGRELADLARAVRCGPVPGRSTMRRQGCSPSCCVDAGFCVKSIHGNKRANVSEFPAARRPALFSDRRKRLPE